MPHNPIMTAPPVRGEFSAAAGSRAAPRHEAGQPHAVDANDPGPRAGRREWIGLAVIALPCMLYSMDLTVLNLALPQLSAQLRPSTAQLLWIVDVYGFLVAGCLITMGTLGDRIGRRRLLMIGAAAFGAASVLAAFSASAGMLIATRALLGVAGATLAPSTLSLIRNMFLDPKQRAFAIGVWVTSYSAGGAIGPLLGGVLLDQFWWGSVFLLGVPVMLVLLVLGPLLLPEFRDPAARPLDLFSAALSLAAVLAVIYALKQFAQDGVSASSVLMIVAGLLVGVLFVRRQRRLADPMIDLALFRRPAFVAALAAYTLGTFIVFGGFLFTAQYLQLVLELSPLHAGLALLPSFLAFIAGSMAAPQLASRVRPAFVMAGGCLVAALGFAMLAQLDGRSGLLTLVVASFLYSVGLAPVFTLATDLVVGSAPPERAGAASAISETSSELGGALGIAILGSLGMAVYRRELAQGLPSSVPALAAAAARETLGGAVDAAAALPEPLRAALTDAAHGAFAHALQVSAIFNTGAVLVLAALAGIALRHLPAGAAAEH